MNGYQYALLFNDCSIRVYRSFCCNLHKCRNIAINPINFIFYYAGIMLNALSDPLCSKLFRHNRRAPVCHTL